MSDTRPISESTLGPRNNPRMEPQGICHRCTHRRRAFPATCDAFPDGIPIQILIGDFIHTTPYPGDKGITFRLKGGQVRT